MNTITMSKAARAKAVYFHGAFSLLGDRDRLPPATGLTDASLSFPQLQRRLLLDWIAISFWVRHPAP